MQLGRPWEHLILAMLGLGEPYLAGDFSRCLRPDGRVVGSCSRMSKSKLSSHVAAAWGGEPNYLSEGSAEAAWSVCRPYGWNIMNISWEWLNRKPSIATARGCLRGMPSIASQARLILQPKRCT